MKIKINNNETTVAEGTTVADIGREQQLPDKGVAVAVNNAMVARSDWGAHALKEGDDIVILKAFCGG